MTTTQIPFKRNAVEPMQCISAGWELVKDRYWLFVGMAAVTMLIGSAVPLGILMGPLMCGMYLTFFKKMRGEPIEFGNLFKGFDFFGPGVVATLLHILPIMAIAIPAYILFYAGMILSVAVQGAGSEPDPTAMIGMLVMFGVFWLFLLVVIVIISIGFTFAHPLIVDRKLQGFDAVKLSFRGAMGNFWRLFLVSLLSGLLSIAGVLLCYVGVFLVLPISYGAIAVAYTQVFGLHNPEDAMYDLPPPPPTFN